jgi:AraC-like DNA-binding protein
MTYSSFEGRGTEVRISAEAEEESKARDIFREISIELRELCPKIGRPRPGTNRLTRSEPPDACDVLALLRQDGYKNVILRAELALAEAAQVRSSVPPEQTNPSSVIDQEVTVLDGQCNGRPAISRNAPWPLQTWRLRRVQDYIQVHISGAIRLSALASAAGLSKMHFAAQFRARTGIRPHEYVIRQRIARAQVLLMVTEIKIADVGLCVGFSNQAHFTTVFHRYVGTTPHRWQRAQIPEGRTTSAGTGWRQTGAHLSQSTPSSSIQRKCSDLAIAACLAVSGDGGQS